MLDFKLLNSQAFLNGELIFRAFLSVHYKEKQKNPFINIDTKNQKFLHFFFIKNLIDAFNKNKLLIY